jgi:hypothetical protein
VKKNYHEINGFILNSCYSEPQQLKRIHHDEKEGMRSRRTIRSRRISANILNYSL